MTTALGLTARAWNGISISRRITDGYVSATAMCQAGGKKWSHYSANARTQAYIAALAGVAGNPATGNPPLIQVIQGGPPHLQGTWIHPRLAIDLARWISPEFAVWMDGWFLEELLGHRQPAPATPATPRRQRRRAEPWAPAEEFNTWWDAASYAQRHAAMLVEHLGAGPQKLADPAHRRLIHHGCQRIMEQLPVLSIQEQLAPVVDLLRDAADRLEAVQVPAIR
jgi:hypothetical protein